MSLHHRFRLLAAKAAVQGPAVCAPLAHARIGMALAVAFALAGCAGFGEDADVGADGSAYGDRAADAELDAARREIDLAARYMDADGVPRDPARAVALLRPHAEGGHPEAQLLLGLAYASGQGVPEDAATAAAWYGKAAVQDQPEAQYLLGLALLRGRGVPKDEQQATRWFDKAARIGHAGAQYHLGLAYAEGLGVDRNETAAAEWLERAAEQGDSAAQYLIGEAYQIGRGVRENRRWAARWFARSAAQGIADAQYMLGLSYAAGSGVPQDMGLALFWLDLAARGGAENAAAMRDRVAEGVGEAIRAGVERKADAWSPVSAGATTRLDDRSTVTFVQYSLAQLGYDPGPIDGHFGPQTRQAIADYEAENGGTASGRLTAELIRRLKAEELESR